MTTIMRNMLAQELPLVLDWAAAEGWNPGREDAAAFLAADPNGFFIAEIDGQPVAAISVVNHNPDFAFLGLYLCRKPWRRQGIGLALWKHALRHAADRTIGLDGVAAQRDNYRRSGFVLAGSTTRFTGRLAAQASSAVERVTSDDFARLLHLDGYACGMRRQPFLRAWVTDMPGRVTVCHRTDGLIDGFATIRMCREGCKIGPVVAGDASTALELARAALAELSAAPVIIDLPDSAAAFAAMLGSLGFVPGFSTARMYKGHAPRPGHSLQAIASMELG